MPIDYGFVSICLSEKDCSPAGNLSVKNITALPDETRIARIIRTARKNLENTIRILWFMSAHKIRLYRFASHLVPLVTHELTEGWEWWHEEELKELFHKIGLIVRKNGFRVSTHLPDYCVMTSEPSKFAFARRYIEYHLQVFRLMGLDDSVRMVTHVGGKYGDAERAIARMEDNFNSLSEEARRLIVLENDDTTYSAAETLAVCTKLGVPMVLDIHHHWCRNDGEHLEEPVPMIFGTWTGGRPPKVHVSSPKSEREPRAHADYVDSQTFIEFAEMALGYGSFDVMVEAKMKDVALLRLLDEIPQKLKPPSIPNDLAGSLPLVNAAVPT